MIQFNNTTKNKNFNTKTTKIKKEDEILSLRLSGLSYRKIKKKLNCNNDSISFVIKKYNLNTNLRNNQKYTNLSIVYPKDCDKELYKTTKGNLVYMSESKNSKENALFKFLDCGHTIYRPWEKVRYLKSCPTCRKNKKRTYSNNKKNIVKQEKAVK